MKLVEWIKIIEEKETLTKEERKELLEYLEELQRLRERLIMQINKPR